MAQWRESGSGSVNRLISGFRNARILHLAMCRGSRIPARRAPEPCHPPAGLLAGNWKAAHECPVVMAPFLGPASGALGWPRQCPPPMPCSPAAVSPIPVRDAACPIAAGAGSVDSFPDRCSRTHRQPHSNRATLRNRRLFGQSGPNGIQHKPPTAEISQILIACRPDSLCVLRQPLRNRICLWLWLAPLPAPSRHVSLAGANRPAFIEISIHREQPSILHRVDVSTFKGVPLAVNDRKDNP